jgi:hypothetical protein
MVDLQTILDPASTDSVFVARAETTFQSPSPVFAERETGENQRSLRQRPHGNLESRVNPQARKPALLQVELGHPKIAGEFGHVEDDLVACD